MPQSQEREIARGPRAARPNPSHCASLPQPRLPLLGASRGTLSAVGTTGGVRMLGDSGRFLCFCLRRSLSFRLWGGKRDQTLMLGNSLGEDKHDTCMTGVGSSQGRGSVDAISPLWRDWRTLAGQEWPRQILLRADSPSLPPSSSVLSCAKLRSCLTLCGPSPPGSSVYGDFPGKNTGVGCHVLLQGIFPIQGSNPGLPHCGQILYHLSHQGSPSSLPAKKEPIPLSCQ